MSQFSQNTQKKQFELLQDGHIAFARYRIEGQKLYIDYVEAPVELRGTGAAGTLMQHIVDYATENNYTILPICGYAVSWLKRHPVK